MTGRAIAGILQVSRDEVDMFYIADWSHRLGLTEAWEMILKVGNAEPDL